MKTPLNSIWARHGRARRPRRQAMALVIVLSTLIFMAALVVAFMSSVNTEMRTSKRYADGINSDLLSQTAFNLAITQITEATRGYDDPEREKLADAPPDELTLAWASQPGMIRTYDVGGNPKNFYRLYSWDKLKGNGAFSPSAEAAQLNAWAGSPAHFTDLNEPVEGQYPIVNPSALQGTNKVEGFEVSGAPATPTNDIPMPVKWLYVLEDGRVVAPTGSGKTATISGADANNQIVGRIAFWADDDTSKVNLNTAGEGTYWDAPKTTSLFDRGLALYQPAQHEYQRYSGHPAMTSLSTVFPGMNKEDIYKVVPRIVGGIGSSLGGTVKASAVINADRDRLYASTDEFMFKPEMSGSVRGQNDPMIDKDILERTKFFLTTASRAPDVSLFNEPRICIWPIYKDVASTRTTAFDRLIAFCSTVNNRIYYFQRENPDSPTNDLPGLASTTGLGRNRMLMEYLRKLTDRQIPGFGDKFVKGGAGPAGKYVIQDRDQILTSIFDYIRSTNLSDPTVGSAFQNKINADGKGSGQAVPIVDVANDTRGFGRYPTVQGAFLLFAGTNTNATNAAVPVGYVQVRAMLVVNMFSPSQGYTTSNMNVSLRVSGMEGFQWQTWNTSGIPSMTNMGFPAPASGTPNVATTSWSMWGIKGFGANMGFERWYTGKTWSPSDYKLVSVTALMPIQNPIGNNPMDEGFTPSSHFDFKGGDLKVEVYTTSGGTDPVQTVTLNFPDAKFPVPQLAKDNIAGNNYRRFTGANSTRLSGNTSSGLITKEDVVRAIVPATGDMRVIMARREIKPTDALYNTWFKPHEDYFNENKIMAHNLRNDDNQTYYGATGGRLLQLLYSGYKSSYYTANNPGMTNEAPRDSSVVPKAVTEDILGDWDNGTGPVPDGPYINKADEGNYGTASHDPYYGYDNSGVGVTMFSPNRMMPSAGMFGSLPTGLSTNTPWQTLVFSPRPLKGNSHIGLQVPKDHLLLDWFHMPVVEPYAISEPLSTGGRINLNYQIVPFNYIERSTGVRALLKSEKVIAIRNDDAPNYKSAYPNKNPAAFKGKDIRFDVDIDETLERVQSKYDSTGAIFRSASQICEVDIIPDDVGTGNLDDYWADRKLTGDNSRERIYTTLYPRLTTKSNTFTIHVKAQALQKRKTSPPTWGTWEEGKDVVISEYRGHQTVERYVDPANPDISDYADTSATAKPFPISDFYKIRVLAAKQFAP